MTPAALRPPMTDMLKTPRQLIRDEILALQAYHVPDPAGMVKLDAMENPYGLPERLRGELSGLLQHAALNRYPDPGATQLKSRLRSALGVPAGSDILLGNGSDEIIQMLVMATARPGAVVMSVDPTFVMFRMIATFCGVRYVGVPLAEGYALDADRMMAAMQAEAPGLVFLAYPNNPTGNLFDEAAVERIVAAAPGLVVIDEAYNAFAGKTMLGRLCDYPNLLVMRTLSKSGLAGLRLGLLAGAPQWLAEFDKIRLPYNINVLTQLVTERVLQHCDVLDEQAAAIRAERARVFDALSAMSSVTVYPTDANFILFEVPDAAGTHRALKERGILIKNLHGSHPRLAGCLRVTIGTPDENTRFIAALTAALAQ
jgi:histidinol-phosphate aminotransferase